MNLTMKYRFIFLIAIFLFAISSLKAEFLGPGEIKPFLIQDKNLKAKCNLLFKKKNILQNCESLKACGFIVVGKHPCGYWVFKHPDCKGWLFKIFCDDQCQDDKLTIFLSSCIGEALIRDYVLTNCLGCYFIVPKKWLYPIYKKKTKRESPSAYVLLEQEIHCFQGIRNEIAWKCFWVTKDLLNCLHHLTCDLGLEECSKIENIPFCKKRKIVLRETHCHSKCHPDFMLLTPCLCEEMQRHWCSLINTD